MKDVKIGRKSMPRQIKRGDEGVVVVEVEVSVGGGGVREGQTTG